MNTESFIKKILESDEFQKFTEEEEVNEMSVTGNVQQVKKILIK